MTSLYTLHTPDISTLVLVSVYDKFIQYLLILVEFQRLLRTLIHYFMPHILSKLKVNQEPFCHNCKLLPCTSLRAYGRIQNVAPHCPHTYIVYKNTETSTETVCVYICMYFLLKGIYNYSVMVVL